MNTNKITNETPILMLTVGQLLELINIDKKQDTPIVQKTTHYVYGLNGIKKLFSVSHATAQRYKDTIIKDAVHQNGRKIVVDVEKAIELFTQKNVNDLKNKIMEEINDITNATPIAFLNVGQLIEIIENSVNNAIAKYQPKQIYLPEKKYIHSIKELADELHMSTVTAQKLKNSGRIPYKQEGRKVIFELNEVLEAMSRVEVKVRKK